LGVSYFEALNPLYENATEGASGGRRLVVFDSRGCLAVKWEEVEEERQSKTYQITNIHRESIINSLYRIGNKALKLV